MTRNCPEIYQKLCPEISLLPAATADRGCSGDYKGLILIIIIIIIINEKI